ncbi:flagellin [Parvularcula sp. IMCC14364]|uniref:flagellin n=1 Tax=Parvularcula sp. IMCC14364 TaxID=3067902 RepID=UPI0027420E54|nr:flagellin [Parvularcula sp. IMCC14364]
MAISSVPDLLSARRFNRSTLELRQRIEVVSQEAVTGRRQDLTEATRGSVGQAHLLNKAVQDIDNRLDLFKVSETRISVMNQTLSGARLTLDSIGVRVLTVLGSNSDAGLDTIIEEAESSLRTVFSAFQVNQGNRNLFSGDATNVSPLGDVDQLLSDVRAIVSAGPDTATIDAELETYFNDPAGGFQTTIYQGGTGSANTVLLDGDTRLDFTVRADDAAIKQVFRGLAMIAAADVTPFERYSDEYTSFFNAGSFNLTNGESGLVQLEARLGIGQQTIANSQDTLEAAKITLSATYNELTSRDQFEAAAELKAIETQLEASYLLTTRLSELTLTNFI